MADMSDGMGGQKESLPTGEQGPRWQKMTGTGTDIHAIEKIVALGHGITEQPEGRFDVNKGFILYEGGAPIGYVMFEPSEVDGKHALLIKNLEILPGHHGSDALLKLVPILKDYCVSKGLAGWSCESNGEILHQLSQKIGRFIAIEDINETILVGIHI
jgi:hypothetical protein